MTINIPDPFIQTLRNAQSVTILTGAGISAESGIPTFRDSQTGLWAKYDPHELATPEAFDRNPALVMDWYRWRMSLVEKSKPNPGHYALAAMERHVPRLTLITQNVDGLHARAGSRSLVELHGSIRRLRCSRCQYTLDHWPEDDHAPQQQSDQRQPPPACPECGALLRLDVVWFGEMLPVSALESAIQASRTCEVFFSIGTSGVVEPAASLPYEALRGGAVVVEINPQPTPLSVHARFYFSQPAGQVLPEILKAAWPVHA